MTRATFAVLASAFVAVAAGITAAVLAAVPVHAASFSTTVVMDEAQALSTCDPNPPPSGGGGTGSIMYDDVTNELSWNISFENLSGAATAAHFHGPAHRGKDAGIQVNIGDLSSPSVGSAIISDAQEEDLLHSRWYVNYHTSACSGGEIRGQVSFAGVGGVAELPGVDGTPLQSSSPSGANAAFIAALAVAAVFGSGALGGAAWLVRKRVLS